MNGPEIVDALRGCPQEGEHDGGQLQRQSGRRRRRALAARAPRGREHPRARRRPRSLRRQRLLVERSERRHDPGGHPQAGRQLPPRRHGRRREGPDRRPDASSPSPTRPGSQPAGRRSLTYDENYKLGTDGAGRRRSRRTSPTSGRSSCKSGIEFNNGKTLSADDVIYSLQRILSSKEGLFGAAGLASIDPKNIQKMDNLTVRLPLKQADSTIGDQLGQYYNGIVPVGYDRTGPLKWVGTGPYVTQSFSPGQQSVHTKNKNYWRKGEPYFDQVTVIDFADSTAQTNALLGGPGRRDHGHPVRPGRRRQVQRRARDPGLAGWRLAAAVHGRRHGAVHRQPRPPGDAPDRRPQGDARAGALRATAAWRTTSTRRSIRASTPRSPSASRTSSRPSRCSSRPACRT